jgi:hypothetical protein
MAEAENLELGGNITLSGFKDIENREMIVLKKIIGNYVRRFRDHSGGYQGLKISMKTVHGEKKFELIGEVILEKKKHNAEITQPNLFMGIDELMKKLEVMLSKD